MTWGLETHSSRGAPLKSMKRLYSKARDDTETQRVIQEEVRLFTGRKGRCRGGPSILIMISSIPRAASIIGAWTRILRSRPSSDRQTLSPHGKSMHTTGSPPSPPATFRCVGSMAGRLFLPKDPFTVKVWKLCASKIERVALRNVVRM